MQECSNEHIHIFRGIHQFCGKVQITFIQFAAGKRFDQSFFVCSYQFFRCRQFPHLQLGAQFFFDLCQFLAFAGGDKGDRRPFAPCSAGSADPVDVDLRIDGQRVIDHVGQPRNIDPACCDVGRHKQTERTILELTDHFRSLCL